MYLVGTKQSRALHTYIQVPIRYLSGTSATYLVHTYTAPELPTSYCLLWPLFFLFYSFQLTLDAMTTIHPDSIEEFEYIQTPAAPEQAKPDFDCGVPTTLVSTQLELCHGSCQAAANLLVLSSTRLSRMLPCPPTHLAATASPMAC